VYLKIFVYEIQGNVQIDDGNECKFGH